MASTLPLVTLALPTYNGAATIREALDHLLAQDYPNIELLIADDASTDETPTICREYAAKHPLIEFRENSENLGTYGNFLNVLRSANGEYVMWASQDDRWAPDFVSALIEPLEADPDCVAAAAATRFIWDDTGEEKRTVRLLGPDAPQRNSYLWNAISILTKRGKAVRNVKNSIFSHCLVRTKAYLTALETFPGTVSNERHILCHLALAGRLFFVDRVLFTKRVRRGSRKLLYPNDPIMMAKQSNSGFLRVATQLSLSIIRSEIVPYRRKIYLPVILYNFWLSRVAEPTVYRLAEHIRSHAPRPFYLALRSLRNSIMGRNRV